MSLRLSTICLFLPLLSVAQTAIQERWEQGYVSEDATAAHVLACWKFDPPFHFGDATGKGHDLRFDGAALDAEGRFGQALKVIPEQPALAKRHAALIPNAPALSPTGPFSMEMWIKPSASFQQALACCLLDKKDITHTDYLWQLTAEERPGIRRMQLSLGFGTHSQDFISLPMRLTPDAWQHVAVTYDATGLVTFHLDGRPTGRVKIAGCGPLSLGSQHLGIGDRIGNTYAAFPGLIDEVRLCKGVLTFAPLTMQILAEKTVWPRMAESSRLYVDTSNLRRAVTASPEIRFMLGDREQVSVLPDLNIVNEARSTRRARYTLDTTLKPGKYRLLTTARSGSYRAEQSIDLQILPRPTPHLPVVMLNAENEPLLHDLGLSQLTAEEIGKMLVQPVGHISDPPDMGYRLDHLAATNAATGKPQKIMAAASLSWDRTLTAPAGDDAPGFKVAWEIHHPDASKITIAPMPLREILWTALSRPIQGILLKDWEALLDRPDRDGLIQQTNPEAGIILKEWLHEVVKPLGPALMRIPDVPAEVVMLADRNIDETAQTWSRDLWRALQHAHVQLDVTFEEALLKNGLNARKVLLLPQRPTLSPSLITRITDWQKKGGKIIADEFLTPDIKADITVPSFKRSHQASEDKAKVLGLAKTLSSNIQSLGCLPAIHCNNPEILLRTRRFGDALYVFVVNDSREPGGYVGQHGRVLENGIPSSAVLTLHADSANVYDLTRSSFVLPKRSDSGDPSWQVDLGPCDGRIFMVTPKPLLGLQVDAPESANLGQVASINIVLTSSQDMPLQGIIPVEVQIRDANGGLAEGSGHYAAENGVLMLQLDIALNEAPGTWEIRVRERASGMQTVKWMRILR